MAEQLRLPYLIHTINRFQLDNNRILDQYVQPQSFIKNKAVIMDWQLNLSFYS